jgi:hypothetical protein
VGKRLGSKQLDTVQTKIPVIIFEEGNKVVAYSPAIDLSTCGDSEEQARKRFVEAASVFFDEINTMGTTDEVLAECGWHKVSRQHSWQPPKYKTYVEEMVPIPQGAN